MRVALAPKLSPATFLWLVRHDLRLWIRGFAAALRLRRAVPIALIALAAFATVHALLWPLAARTIALWRFPAAREAIENQVAFAGAVLASVVAASSLRRTVDLVFAKADLDLVLASPMRPQLVVMARACALALGGGALGALFWAPFADDAAWIGGFSWLAIYPTMIAATFAASAVGVALAIGLFAIFGARRARLPAQFAQALIGLTYFFLAAAGLLLPKDWASALTHPAHGALLDHRGALFAPVRAALGDPLALAFWLPFAALVFLAAARLLGLRLVRAAGEAAGLAASAGRATPLKAFAAGPSAALARKERRLARRNPALIALAAMFVVMAAPIVVQILRGGFELAPPIAASVIVLFAGQMAIAFASMAFAEEAAPDLVLTAPITPSGLLFGKIGAFAPILAIGVLAPSAALNLGSSSAAACAAVFGLGGAASVTLCVALMREPPPSRFGARRSAISPLAALMLQIVAVSWTLAASLATLGRLAALAPLVFGGLAMLAARPRHARALTSRAAWRRSLRRRPWRAPSAIVRR